MSDGAQQDIRVELHDRRTDVQLLGVLDDGALLQHQRTARDMSPNMIPYRIHLSDFGFSKKSVAHSKAVSQIRRATTDLCVQGHHWEKCCKKTII